MKSKEILKATDIRKNYGHIEALRGVDFNLYEGEILGLIGDNAAGKSTFIKILSGAVLKDSGKIFIDEKEVNINSPTDAKKLGIETVYQTFALVDNLNVYKNIYLGRLLNRKMFGLTIPIIDKSNMYKKSLITLEKMGIKFDKAAINDDVLNLSGGQRQTIAIARAISFNPKILILDEPTSGLAVKEIQHIQDIILNFKQKRGSVIFISHRLESVFQVSDRVVVLRNGEKVFDEPIKNVCMENIGEYMFGLKKERVN